MITRRPLSSVCWLKGIFMVLGSTQKLRTDRRRGTFVARDRDFSGHPLSRGDKRLAGRPAPLAHHQRNAAVAALANRLIDRNPAEECDTEVLCHLLPAAM